jgi:hypothetical protein
MRSLGCSWPWRSDALQRCSPWSSLGVKDDVMHPTVPLRGTTDRGQSRPPSTLDRRLLWPGGDYARTAPQPLCSLCHYCSRTITHSPATDAAITELIAGRRCAIADYSARIRSPPSANPAEETPPPHTTPRHPPTPCKSPTAGLRSPCLGLTFGFVTCLLASSGPTQNYRGPCHSSVVDLTEHSSSPPAHLRYQQGIPVRIRWNGTLTAPQDCLRQLSPITHLTSTMPSATI